MRAGVCVFVPFCSLCNFFFCFATQKEKKGGGSDRNKTSSICLGKHFFGGWGGVIWLDKK